MSVTFVLCGKLPVHVVGQLIPAGLLVTTPLPVPAMVTVSDSLGTTVVVNDALTAYPPSTSSCNCRFLNKHRSSH